MMPSKPSSICRFAIQLVAVLFCSICGAQPAIDSNNVPAIFNTLAELAASKSPASTAFVKETPRGGIFNFTRAKATPDSGINIKSARGGVWQRVYRESQGVDLEWFGTPDDSGRYRQDALRSALNFKLVNISNPVTVAGKFELKEGATVVFRNRGCLLLADSSITAFNANVKADDYANIAKGAGRLVFGTTSCPYVSACWFGAVADNSDCTPGRGTDNALSIARAIAAAEKVSEVYLPPTMCARSYRIASGITISKPAHFFSMIFRGGGTSTNNGTTDRATTLFADFTSGPAINIQGSRRSYISDMRILGRNQATRKVMGAQWDNPIYGTPAYDTVAYFYDKGMDRSYAAIATDAEKGNKVWSADIQFENLLIQGFYLGIDINAAGNMQGDRMRVYNSQIAYCTYGISIGNPQARACNFENVDMNYVYIGFTNNTFGNGTGSEFQITGGQYCNLYKLFKIQPYNLGQCVVTGLYTEALGSIGDIGFSGPHNNSFIFTGCNFMMQDASGRKSSYGYYSKFYTLSACANVTFEGCNFWTRRPYIAFRAGNGEPGTHSAINFSGCTFYRSSFLHSWGDVNLDHCHLVPYTEWADPNQTVRATLSGNRRINTGYDAAMVIPLNEQSKPDTPLHTAVLHIERTIPRFFKVLEASSCIKDTAWNNDTLSFTYYGASADSFFHFVLEGENLGTTLAGLPTGVDNPALKVLRIDRLSHRVSCFAYTETVTLRQLALYTNCFFTTMPVTGSVTAGEDEVRGIVNIEMLAKGDYIKMGEGQEIYRIMQLDTAAHTARILPNPQTSATTAPIYNLMTHVGS